MAINGRKYPLLPIWYRKGWR